MRILINFLPLLIVFIYLGSGLYFTAAGIPNAFYQLSPIVAIIPGIALELGGFTGGSNQERLSRWHEAS